MIFFVIVKCCLSGFVQSSMLGKTPVWYSIIFMSLWMKAFAKWIKHKCMWSNLEHTIITFYYCTHTGSTIYTCYIKKKRFADNKLLIEVTFSCGRDVFICVCLSPVFNHSSLRLNSFFTMLVYLFQWQEYTLLVLWKLEAKPSHGSGREHWEKQTLPAKRLVCSLDRTA